MSQLNILGGGNGFTKRHDVFMAAFLQKHWGIFFFAIFASHQVTQHTLQ